MISFDVRKGLGGERCDGFVTAIVAAEILSVVVVMACSNGGDYCG